MSQIVSLKVGIFTPTYNALTLQIERAWFSILFSIASEFETD